MGQLSATGEIPERDFWSAGRAKFGCFELFLRPLTATIQLQGRVLLVSRQRNAGHLGLVLDQLSAAASFRDLVLSSLPSQLREAGFLSAISTRSAVGSWLFLASSKHKTSCRNLALGKLKYPFDPLIRDLKQFHK